MELSCLIKASLLSLVVMVTVLDVCVTSAALPAMKCSESNKKECGNAHSNAITGSNAEGGQNVGLPSSSGSKKAESSQGEQLPGQQGQDQGQGHSVQPLSRRSRDIGAADREMLLQARGFVSRVMDNMAAEGAEPATVGWNSPGISGDALLRSFEVQRILSELKNNQLVRRLLQWSTTHSKPKQTDKEDELDSEEEEQEEEQEEEEEEDSLYPDTSVTGHNSELSSGRRAKNTAQAPWAEQQTRAESDLMRMSAGRVLSGSRLVQKRNPSHVSVNNAMMAITNMVRAQQKQRLMKNRELIRQHMLIQG
ncbi:hypothetical protein EGW08_022048 [Elysia chlorotica]|uniref:Corticotropin-releasing factor domain-containing protein n=1 Tax=Elysia chlorotica TaxID=188477 RepID=A0A3S0Z409_ELYCH|nr:hypothetical protein EGW08_022048 [Elysia chlorotica]